MFLEQFNAFIQKLTLPEESSRKGKAIQDLVDIKGMKITLHHEETVREDAVA